MSFPFVSGKPATSKKSFIVLILSAVLLVGLVGFSVYDNLAKGKISSRRPRDLAQQPSFLYSLKGAPAKGLKEPMSVAVNSKGYIFIADTGNKQIQVYYPNGSFAWAFGNKEQNKLAYPYGLAILDNENLLVADSGVREIMEFTPKGTFVKTLVSSEGNIRPGSATRGPKGKIYVSDLGAQQVLILDGSGNLVEKINGKGQFQYPQGIAVTEDGSLYLADSGNFRVELLNKQGKVSRVLSGPGTGINFTMVRGLALDNLNRLYVSDTMANQVRVFGLEHNELFKLQASPDGELKNPMSVTIDNWGRIFIADRGNDRIQVWGYPNK